MRAAALLGTIIVLMWLATAALVSPASVAATIRDEHHLHAVWLGEPGQRSILNRALSWLGHASEVGGQIGTVDPARPDPMSVRLAAAADAALQTPYVQAVRALARLVLYRVAALAEWISLGFPLLLAATIDGVVMRAVRGRSFGHASPVLFGVGLHGAFSATGCVVVAVLIPRLVHPLIWVVLVALLGAAARAAVANFHRIR